MAWTVHREYAITYRKIIRPRNGGNIANTAHHLVFPTRLQMEIAGIMMMTN
jgi:hypothetical protein